MKLHGSSAACCEGDSLDAHPFLRDQGAAGVARFPGFLVTVKWSSWLGLDAAYESTHRASDLVRLMA